MSENEKNQGQGSKAKGTERTQGTKGTPAKDQRPRAPTVSEQSPISSPPSVSQSPVVSLKSPSSLRSLSPADRTPPSSAPHRPSAPLPTAKGFIPAHGGYEDLLSFQKSRIVYDGTVRFCERFVDKYSRTTDQMVQAARSGKQNILEGSQASGTSKETEIKLTNVARASLEELLEDYRDFLRVRDISEWPKDHSHTRRLRTLNRQPNANYETFRKGIEHPDPAIAANVMIGLIKLTNYLLDQQLKRLEQDFLNDGGLRERMTRARLDARAKNLRRGPHDS